MISKISEYFRHTNKIINKSFNKWKYLNDHLKIKDLLDRKNKQRMKLSIINNKIFYAKKNPKTDIKVLKKDFNNIKIYAINCIINNTKNILFNNKKHIFAKIEFFNNFLSGIKLSNTLRHYGENYKKIQNFVGIENYSERKKNVLLVREVYQKYFQLQKIFILIEKYRYRFSRYLNFSNNPNLVTDKTINTNNDIKQIQIINNILSTNLNLAQQKIYTMLNITSTADCLYFNKKKEEAKNSFYANIYVSTCFYKWKMILHRSFVNKIELKKSLIILICKIEDIVLNRFKNEGKYFLISNMHIDNDRKDFIETNNENRRLNSTNPNKKKLILIEEKIKIHTKYNKFVFLCKLEFFEKLKSYQSIRIILENKISKYYNNIIYIICNIFNNKKKLTLINCFYRLQDYYNNKTKYLQKIESLKTIFELIRLDNVYQIGKTKNLIEFTKKYYTNIQYRKNNLQKYFSKWKDELESILKRIKIDQKFYFHEKDEELSSSIYLNNKIIFKELEKNTIINKNLIMKISSVNINEINTFNQSEKIDVNFKTNYEKNEEFGKKVVNFSNNEFEVFFFKILAESIKIPKSKIGSFLRNKINAIYIKNLNYLFKKFRVKLNMYYVYNKILAGFYYNNGIDKNSIKYKEIIKDENYFLKLNEKKIYPSLPEQMGNKIRITEQPKKPRNDIESTIKIASFSQKLNIQRIDYLINQNQSKIILDYENDEIKLDKDINLSKKFVCEKNYIKLSRIIFLNKIKQYRGIFNKWKNFTFFTDKEYYSNILDNFENVRIENDMLTNTLNKAKSDYKKLIQDYKTLKNFFCESCMNGGEDFNLDMKSVISDNNSNINISDLNADSNYNSENLFLNRRKSKLFLFL